MNSRIVRSFFFSLVLITSASFLAKGQEIRKWTLEECVAYAIENNLTIERNRLNVQTRAIDLDQSKASRYPNANFNISYGMNWGRSIDPTTNLFIAQRIGSSGLSAGSSMVLFNWFNLRDQQRQTRTSLEATQFDLEKSQDDITLNVITFYTNVIFNQELLENAKLQVESTRRQLERTGKQVEVGALPRTNLLDLQSQEATNELAVINAENNLDFAILQLKQVLQIPANEPLEIVIPEIEVDENPAIIITEHQVYEQALKTMPQIKSANKSVEGSMLGIDIAKSNLYPTFTLNARYSTNFSDFFTERFIPDGTFSPVDEDGDGIPDTRQIGFVQSTLEPVLSPKLEPNGVTEDFGLFSQYKENRSTFVGVSMAIPIFNGLQSRSGYQRAIISNKQAEIIAEEARNNLRQVIEIAFNDVLASSKAYGQSSKQVHALEESFRITEQRYNLQAVSYVDYEVASNNLFQAHSDQLRAKYDFIFKQKILDFYLGNPITFDQ